MTQCRARLAVIALAAFAGTAVAQDVPVLPVIPSHRVTLALDTGDARPSFTAGTVIARLEVHVPNAAWLRLTFADVRLAGDAAADGTVIRLTSAADGAIQLLNAETLAQWSGTSAYFNGDRVIVELVSNGAPGKSRLAVAGAEVGDWLGGTPLYAPRTICGPTDDRTLSSDPRNGRIVPIGCTAGCGTISTARSPPPGTAARPPRRSSSSTSPSPTPTAPSFIPPPSTSTPSNPPLPRP